MISRLLDPETSACCAVGLSHYFVPGLSASCHTGMWGFSPEDLTKSWKHLPTEKLHSQHLTVSNLYTRIYFLLTESGNRRNTPAIPLIIKHFVKFHIAPTNIPHCTHIAPCHQLSAKRKLWLQRDLVWNYASASVSFETEVNVNSLIHSLEQSGCSCISSNKWK